MTKRFVASKRSYQAAASSAVLLAVVSGASAYSTGAAVTAADWTFETSQPTTAGPFSPEVGNGAATGFHSGTTVYSNPAGNGSAHSFSSNDWLVNDYYQFSTSTSGLTGISIAWDQTSSSTGPAQFALEYSSNGGSSFTTFGNYSVVGNGVGSGPPAWNGTTGNTLYNISDNLSSITALNNNGNVVFRLIDVGTVPTGNASGTVATAGTDRVDNFTISQTITINNLVWEGGSTTWDNATTQWSDVLGGGTADAVWSAAPNTANTTIAHFQTGDSVNVNAGGVTAEGLAFDAGANGVSISGPGTISLSGNFVNVDPSVSATLGAQISGSTGLAIAGTSGNTAVVLLTNTSNSFAGNVSIAAGTLRISDPRALGGAPGVIIGSNGTLRLDAPMTIASSLGATGTGGTLDDEGNNINFTSPLSGGSAINKSAAGTLTLSTTSSATASYTGTFTITNGFVDVNSVNSAGLSAFGSGSIRLGNSTASGATGGTLVIDATTSGGNLTIGTNVNSGKEPGFIDTLSGSTLIANGNATLTGNFVTATLNYDGFNNFDAYLPGTYDLGTANATSSLTLVNPYRQFDTNGTTPGGAGSINPNPYYSDPNARMTTHVTGGGRVILEGGDVGSGCTAYGGDWSIDNGTLQLGPFPQDPNPGTTTTSITTWTGPAGQTLNGLGFYTPKTTGNTTPNSDPDLPNTVTINVGGTLAIAVDQLNANPYVSAASITATNSTPNYIRNSIVLSGGAIAATGQEVTWNTLASGLGEGIPDGVAVKAELGGNFTVASNSTIDVFDPVGGTGAREVDLVGGERTLTVAGTGAVSGSYANSLSGSPLTLTYETSWAGTLEIASGNTTGGIFNIDRSTIAAGCVSVTAGATIQVDPGAILELNGAAALTDGAGDNVNIVNNSVSSLDVQTGNQTTGNISGVGNTNVSVGASLTAGTLTQTTLTNNGVTTIGAGTSTIGSIAGAGNLTISSGGNVTTGPMVQGIVDVAAGAKLTIAQATVRNLSDVSILEVGGTNGDWLGAVDLTNSRLVVEDTAGNRSLDIATYKDMVLNNGNSTVGIYSSYANSINAAAGKSVETIAVVDNAVRLATDGPTASNFGTGVNNVDANSILITATYLGDANLDGVVDIKDLQVLANNWQKNVTDWSQGDFNGDGIVDIRDLQFIANDWQDGVGAPGAGSGESFSQALALLPLFSGTSSVPEPTSLALLGVGGAMLASRRRRK